MAVSTIIDTRSFLQYVNVSGFMTGINTGISQQYINFPFTFAAIPQVQATMDIGNNSSIYGFVVAQRSQTGCMAYFSEIIMETGIQLCIWASI